MKSEILLWAYLVLHYAPNENGAWLFLNNRYIDNLMIIHHLKSCLMIPL